jgi:hypothetical protein
VGYEINQDMAKKIWNSSWPPGQEPSSRDVPFARSHQISSSCGITAPTHFVAEPEAVSVRGAYAKNSIGMARLRLDEVEEVGAEVLPTECNSCVHNLNNAKVRAQNFKIYTTPQFLNHLLKQSE